MNKKTFNQYIADSNFRELFIREMGWNNPKGQTSFDITIDETTYGFQQIADRSGFQVLTCLVDSIPTSSVSKKIDTRLRKLANDYICIYYLPHSEHHLWVVPVKKVEKRDLVLVEYESANKADFLFEKMEDLCFALDEHTTIMDVKERVQAGFIINSEKITKDFYTGFRKEHTNFAKYITGIDDYIDEENKKRDKSKQVPNRNKQWYTSVMLNRLMFCYFIQKKGFLNLNPNYLRDKLAWVKSEKGEGHFYDSFYRGFLVSLFHDGLNSPRHQQDFVQKYGRIPYLNGGMFSIHELEEKYPTLDIADEAFESLFAFFDQWHWHLDDRLTASGKDINPDVLGYIFEQYINDRAQMGAYYTKEDITEYIGRNTILPFLMDATKKTDDKPFKTNGAVWQFLKASGDTYIYDAVKKGAGVEIPEEIAVGLDTTKPNLLERRSHWNEKTPEAFALPTEIWRETIERLQRYANIKAKIENGEISEINDFITYNLDIRQFVQDLLAQTDDHLFIKHFYAQLRKVTILDPTCGSGAFLFAALNILEPLYEVCIDRMQSWNNDNPNLFNSELEEINGKYRSNIRYFIYKNIILRNLYGVDIMVEATEIAKLRLFLKMVAVVDVVPRDPNLGLDPLPDIDFNIRCGNTLVGYATAKDLENDLQYGDMFAKQEFEDKVHLEMDKVAYAYERFKQVQLQQSENLNSYKESKAELKGRLKGLNALLNDKLYKTTVSGGSLKYEDWLKSHQPFHWLAEYYDIINGNKGFDVIIGNPPYVEYNKKDKVTGLAVSDIYKLHGYETKDCSNLYAFCVERSRKILNDDSHFGMIIPLSITCGDRMAKLRTFVNKKYTNRYVANFEIFPSKLFEGAFQRVTILLCNNTTMGSYITKLYRWYAIERSILFQKIVYTSSDNVYISLGYAKLYTNLHTQIIQSVNSKFCIANYIQKGQAPHLIYYQEATNYWMKASMRIPYYKKNNVKTAPAHGRFLYFDTSTKCNVVFALMNSSLFYCWYSSFSDGFHLTDGMVKTMPIKHSLFGVAELQELALSLENDIKLNSFITTRNTKKDDIELESFRINLSKKILDKIDKVLAKHYGFTEEELDFIINYDIKYRMGDELGEEGEAEPQQKQETIKPLQSSRPQKQRKQKTETKEEPKEATLTMIVRQETLERIRSGEKTTFKRYLNDEEFAKQVLVTENGKIKLSRDHCPYTAKNFSSLKFVCDGESLVKKITKISFRTGLNPQGKTAWKIIFQF